MPKGKIKELVSPTSPIEVKHLTTSLTLHPVKMERGEGFYPGLVNDDKTTSMLLLEKFFTKTEQVLNDDVLRPRQFLGRIVDSLNASVFRPTWREVMKDTTKATPLTEDKLKEFNAALVSAILDQRAPREQDSSYWRKQMAKIGSELLPLKKKANGKASNLTAEELATYKQIQAAYKLAEENMKKKEAEELAALDDLDLDDIDVELS